MKIAVAIITTLLAGCAEPARRTFGLGGPAEPALAHGQRGEGWERAGVREVPVDLADVQIWVEFMPLRDRGVLGLASREQDLVYLDDQLRGFELAVIAAHEIGHVVLDTGEHTDCGIMGSRDVLPCDDDLALADRRLKDAP